LFQTTCRETGVIMWVQLLEDPPHKFWEGQKNVQISTRFLTTFDFDREYLPNGSTYRKSKINWINCNALYVGEKKLVNFGPQTKEIQLCILTHSNGFFSGDYILALRECCPLKFLDALDIDLGYLVHPPTGTGVPQKSVIAKKLNFGVKFSM